jgi:2-oxoisovalerate dehydrogenase E1 component alpha subunit
VDATGPLSSDGLVQLLDHHGHAVDDEVYGPFAAHLTADDLRAFWRDMTVLRAFDLEATSLQRQG